MKTLVVIVIIVGLLTVAASIIVGSFLFDGRVAERPYEEGLEYDNIERLKSEFSFNLLTEDCKKGENEVIFSIHHREVPITDLTLNFILSRPGTDRYDNRSMVEYIKPGVYKAKVTFPEYGYWDMKIRIIWQWREVALTKRVYVKDK